MKYETAKWWADTITELLGGKQVAKADAMASRNWRIETEVITIEKATAFRYKHAPEDGHFHIVSSYGIHFGEETVSIDADKRTIRLSSKTAFAGGAGERTFTLLNDEDRNGWAKWHAKAQEAYRLK